eukprot:gb/GEZN01003854.1/.p1 GENE.gb/GEZN01003854.1/~~gb/GEZN01003854.1/.p1  ORF type:complete len:687 (+),score=76.50 gb/GEZN01003854.1/:231-2063(+)
MCLEQCGRSAAKGFGTCCRSCAKRQTERVAWSLKRQSIHSEQCNSREGSKRQKPPPSHSAAASQHKSGTAGLSDHPRAKCNVPHCSRGVRTQAYVTCCRGCSTSGQHDVSCGDVVERLNDGIDGRIQTWSQLCVFMQANHRASGGRSAPQLVSLERCWQVMQAEQVLPHFLSTTLPYVCRLAMELFVCGGKRPNHTLLKAGQPRTLRISRTDVACYIALAALCIALPQRNLMADFSLYRVYSSDNKGLDPQVAKIRCLFNYLERCRRGVATEGSSFGVEEVVLTRTKSRGYTLEELEKLPMVLCPVDVLQDVKLEEVNQGEGAHVDFANKHIGGGSLGNGAVQEEIAFYVHPELLVSMLFVEDLEDLEALLISGYEQFNAYRGYAQSFEWAADFVEKKEVGKKRKNCMICIDAVNFSAHRRGQYEVRQVLRDLNKAAAGFDDAPPGWIATGAWGCGVFGGDPQLKFCLQWLAASASPPSPAVFASSASASTATVSRTLKYCAYQANDTMQGLEAVVTLFGGQISVGELFEAVSYYCQLCRDSRRSFPPLFEMLISRLAPLPPPPPLPPPYPAPPPPLPPPRPAPPLRCCLQLYPPPLLDMLKDENNSRDF